MKILLNPGPVNLSERVRNALLKQDLCHREVEFSNLQNSIREKLLDIYSLPAEEYTAVLITGSGTSTVEAMICSLIPKDGKLLIIENGVYGERLSKIARIYNILHQSLTYPWGKQIKVVDVENKLADGFTHLSLVHHETTTGRLNDIATIAEVCHSKNTPILLDAVSSFGAEEIEFKRWNIAACSATANKCLHGVPGTSFVIVNRDILAQAKSVQRSLYLDLHSYIAQQDIGGTPFTQSVQSFYALNEALTEHRDEGGWTCRRESYKERMEAVVNGLANLGIEPLLPAGVSSCVLNSFHLPNSIDYQTLHDKLKQHGFIIYAGQGNFAKSIFRISLMGCITTNNIEDLLSAIKSIISEQK